MTQGRLIAVVGPSGAGKDSVMLGVHEAFPKMHVVRRVITRAPELGGELYTAVNVVEFDTLTKNGAFAVHWKAHGLRYGISITVQDQLNSGTDCLANLSRSALNEAARIFPRLLVLNISARPEILARRIAARGREDEEEIALRLATANKPLPAGLEVIHLTNDGPLDETVARAVDLLRPLKMS